MSRFAGDFSWAGGDGVRDAGGPDLSASVTVCVLGRSVLSDSVPARALWPARLFCPWGFSREERWSGLPRPPPGDLPDPGIELAP